MRVVVRRSTGVSNCSLISSPAPTRSLASWLSPGSRQGTRANFKPPVVLLVLRAVHLWVIGADDHQPGLDAGYRGVEKGVGRHVEAQALFFHFLQARGWIRLKVRPLAPAPLQEQSRIQRTRS